MHLDQRKLKIMELANMHVPEMCFAAQMKSDRKKGQTRGYEVSFSKLWKLKMLQNSLNQDWPQLSVILIYYRQNWRATS